MMETFFFFVIGLALAYGVGCLGRKRKNWFRMGFLPLGDQFVSGAYRDPVLEKD